MADNDKGIIKHIPNALTIGRFMLTFVLLGMLLYAPRIEDNSTFLLIAFILFIVTALTDIVDGHIARKFEVTSKFGRIADPLADKILVCGSFLCFAIVGQPIFGNFDLPQIIFPVMQWGIAVLLLAREVWVTVVRHIAESRGIEFGAKWSGKLKMFLQSFGIGTVIFKWAYITAAWADWFTITVYILLAVVTVYSGIEYSLRKTK